MGGPGRGRHSLANRKLASSFYFYSTAGQENSSERQTWIVCQRDLAPPPPPGFLVWPHPLAAPNRSTGWLSRDSEPPLSASYLAVPHSFLPPLWLLHHPSPSIAESFCFVSPRGGVRLSNGRGARENGSERLKWKTDSDVNQRHFLLQDPPLPLSVESYWICCHTRFLQTTPTMYLTVQYCAKLASHDYFCFIFMMLLV